MEESGTFSWSLSSIAVAPKSKFVFVVETVGVRNGR